METISGEMGWNELGHSSLASVTTGRTNLTSSLFSDFTSLNSSHEGAGSYYWIIPENASATTPHALPQPRVRDLGLARAEIGVLGLVLALTTLGNSFVLWVLLRRRKHNAPMHLFMVNLCLADLVVALFQVFPQLLWDITERFQGPDFLCRSVKYLQIVGMFASSYMIVAMTVDRHYAICCPLQAYRGGTVSRWNTPIMMAWGLALLLSIPQLFIFSRSEVSPGEFECWAHFAEPWGLKAYITWMTLAVFLLPALIITVCQIRIFREIHNNIYLKSERMVSAELKKNNEVIFHFHRVKKDDNRMTRERGRGGCRGGRGAGVGGEQLLKTMNNNPSSTLCNPLSPLSPQSTVVVPSECCPYLSPSPQYSNCHNNHTALPSSPRCVSSPRPSLEYPPPPPRALMPPSISKAMSKTVRMTLVIVLVYTVCWSPFFIVQLDRRRTHTETHLLSILSSTVCPNIWVTEVKNMLLFSYPQSWGVVNYM
uniref:Arginine vasopressin receptor 2a, duplicate a n=1 Tax=Hucho hucho TaxID=62062 RepID=A0A4W5QWY2_9TELE